MEVFSAISTVEFALPTSELAVAYAQALYGITRQLFVKCWSVYYSSI